MKLMIKLRMSNVRPYKKNIAHRVNNILSDNKHIKSKNININTLLNRVKVNKKKEITNKLTLLCLSSLTLLIFGIFVF